ncbi:hypothetical protein ACWEPH_05505 [Nocardia beijingensis]|uniref:hypothetical protein n=1 Tax=Nocardia beijingensis TaxID=95162 RepID=UPI0018963BA8|nr:hypothetical protein [Nocardia beijingensis]MBF6078593.1 hypothetical protein [Nocardia beijingensis]
MAAPRTYLVRLDPLLLGDGVTPRGGREQFFDWLADSGAEVVRLCGADRVVIAAEPEVADRVGYLEYVLGVEPYE